MAEDDVFTRETQPLPKVVLSRGAGSAREVTDKLWQEHEDKTLAVAAREVFQGAYLRDDRRIEHGLRLVFNLAVQKALRSV